MAQIYDFFRRRNMNQLAEQNYTQDDQIVENCGKYIGVLTKQKTESLRRTIDMLEFKKNQIEIMMSEYEELWFKYEQMASKTVDFLEVRKNGVEFD